MLMTIDEELTAIAARADFRRRTIAASKITRADALALARAARLGWSLRELGQELAETNYTTFSTDVSRHRVSWPRRRGAHPRLRRQPLPADLADTLTALAEARHMARSLRDREGYSKVAHVPFIDPGDGPVLRRLVADGWSQAGLARALGVSPWNILAALRRR